MSGGTEIAIRGEQFFISGAVTYPGVTWKGQRIEGLLLNSRMVQGIFDDLNPETRGRWAYPDTGRWDADRNTDEFIAAMPSWRAHGVLAVTVNLQGGSPYGYSKDQPWINSAIAPDGSLRGDHMERLRRILNAADELGMAVIVGLFYFGQEKELDDEAAVIRGVDNAVDWMLDQGHRNVLIEINNECNVRYRQPLLMPERVNELIARAQGKERDGRRLLAGTSYGGGVVPGKEVVRQADFLLLHGNHVETPGRIREMVRQTRQVEGYTPKPILFNEDDHFAFDQPDNNFIAAVDEYASWGFFDYRMEGERYNNGYQSVPVNWRISSDRKRGFFNLARQITGQ
ncbi:MAG: hypothetical protein QF512_14135 [Alphaproteobacteria bacterium]|nr:hypothetical protein [Alphaproteobacteria bacterium]